MLEVISVWTGPGHSPKLSINHYSGTGLTDAQTAASRMRTLWDALKAQIVGGVSVTIDPEVREIDPITGTLVAVHTISPGAVVAGTGSGAAAADATQYLIRWNTGTVVNGRVLKGRTYVPGVPVAAEVGGNVSASVVTAINSAISVWLSGGQLMQIWHRPNTDAGSPGSAEFVQGGTLWNEFAVQRRRRG